MKMEEGEGMQLIDGNGKFNMEGLQGFMTTTEFAQSGLSYAIVAIIGPQSSGKSTLMNQTFHTNFKEMNAYEGRGQTTKGIWIAKCGDIDPFTIVMDFEGTDSNQRGEVMKRLFKPCKKTLLFLIRDHTKTPFSYLKTVLLEDIEKAAVSEPETHGSASLSDFFNVEITALSSFEFEEEKFKQQVAQLRQRFVHSIYPGGLVDDRQEVEPASVFPIRAEEIWKTIKNNKDLDLPALKFFQKPYSCLNINPIRVSCVYVSHCAYQVMVAAVRCEEIAEEKLKRFTSDEDWLAMKEAVQAGPVSGFGEAVSSSLDSYLSEYDMEVTYFDQEVRKKKRRQLLTKALMVVNDTYVTLLVHLYSNMVKSFKTRLEQSLNEGQEYVASVHLCFQSCMLKFDQGCQDAAIRQSEWNTVKFRDKVIAEMMSEVMAKYEKQLDDLLAERLEPLFEAGDKDMWAPIRDLLECNSGVAVSEFSDAVACFELYSAAVDTKLQHLREYARHIVEKKAREAADPGRVLMHMKDRFTKVFSDADNSVSWYNWSTETDIDEIEWNALSASLKYLSVMAAMRLDDAPDQIKYVLFSSLMNRTAAAPSFQDTGRKTTMDLLVSSDTWEEVSPTATTLLKPEDCKLLWMRLKEEMEFMVTTARSNEVARRQTRSNILAGVGVVGGIAIMGPAAALAVLLQLGRQR